MAHRLEKEANGEYALVIDGFEEGIAPDPYSGMGLMQSVDLETPGEVAVGYPITASTTSGGTLGSPIARSTRYFPTYITQGQPTGLEQSYAILDASGQVWERSASSISGAWTFLSSSNSTTGSSNLDGIVYWLGYLIKFRNQSIDYWNGSAWSAGWITSSGTVGDTTYIATGVKHFAYVASNNQLYFTNGNFLGRIFAPDPDAFAPGTASTYDFNASILRIPVNDVALSLAEVGGGNSSQSTLLVGGALNAIYPWDKLSTSFGLPIYVAESYIGRMVSANQNAFIFPGRFAGRGNIYITNGSQADVFYKIPDYIFGQQDPYFFWGDAIFHRNNLVFGMIPISNTGTNPNSNSVWALRISDKVFRSISRITTATSKMLATVLIPIVSPNGSPLFPPGFGYFIGWNDDSTGYGIGLTNTPAGTNSAGSSILTDLVEIGTYLEKKTYQNLEVKLRTPLESGESFTVTPIVDSVTGSALTFSQPTPTTGTISSVANVNFQGAQWLQFLVTQIGNSLTSGVRLYEIRIR